MRACVTGGAGFIGGHLVQRLVQDGCDVVVLDDLSTGDLANLDDVAGRIRFVHGDIRNPQDVRRAVAGCDVVYHLAALASVARSIEQPAVVHDVNVAGTLKVLTAARDAGVRRVVFSSSSSVYGDCETLPKTPDIVMAPRSPYAASKAAGESYCQAFFASYGLETVALRYFNVYGPRQSPHSQYAAVIPVFIDRMLRGESPRVHGDGLQSRDFTFVGDVVDAIVRAGAAVGAPGRVFNVGCGDRTTILDLVHAVAGAVGYQGDVRHEAARTGDVRHSLACIADTRRVLGWEPTVDLTAGIARTVDATPLLASGVAS